MSRPGSEAPPGHQPEDDAADGPDAAEDEADEGDRRQSVSPRLTVVSVGGHRGAADEDDECWQRHHQARSWDVVEAHRTPVGAYDTLPRRHLLIRLHDVRDGPIFIGSLVRCIDRQRLFGT